MDIVVKFKIDTEFVVLLQILWFKYKAYPFKERKKKVKKGKTQKVQQSKKPNRRQAKTDIKEIFKTIYHIYNSSSDLIQRFLGKIIVSKLFVEIIIGGDDPAQIAIEYGKTNAYVYSVLGILKNICIIKNQNINIGLDYQQKNTAFKLQTDFKLRLITLIIIIVRITFRHKGIIKDKEEKTYGRA
jgi:hypothetical protein